MQNFYPAFAYLLGSIPFGLIFSNLFGNGNLRSSGSKNIGATNVLRTQGKILGGMAFFFDFSKGLTACYLLQTESEILNLVIIMAPVIGHIFPVWLKFNGGKGIATYLGVLCSLDIFVFLISGTLWIFTFFITKISSVSGLVSVISSLFIFGYIKYTSHLDFFNQLCALICIVVLIIIKHRENIRRILNNEELRI
ncbi:MAG: glycerol-3-phosphate 1-O-acyltransferase PlsY [Holosporaceae bacterium]|nr:glycerol-3-phosphate 1-O-acyltransferase PlsY [Holosporaceae bacterium]